MAERLDGGSCLAEAALRHLGMVHTGEPGHAGVRRDGNENRCWERFSNRRGFGRGRARCSRVFSVVYLRWLERDRIRSEGLVACLVSGGRRESRSVLTGSSRPERPCMSRTQTGRKARVRRLRGDPARRRGWRMVRGSSVYMAAARRATSSAPVCRGPVGWTKGVQPMVHKVRAGEGAGAPCSRAWVTDRRLDHRGFPRSSPRELVRRSEWA